MQYLIIVSLTPEKATSVLYLFNPKTFDRQLVAIINSFSVSNITLVEIFSLYLFSRKVM